MEGAGSRLLLGYCTNVHAGIETESILANLRQCALPVRRRLGRSKLGVGLWFSQGAAKELVGSERLNRFAQELDQMGLVAYTINGFPQDDFHQKVVKHGVYRPAWWEPARLEYTRDLVRILDRLLPSGVSGSISTLPIGWGSDALDGGVAIPGAKQEDRCAHAASQLLSLAGELNELYERTGRRIRIALEPEPGCVFTDHASMRAFYDRWWTSPWVSSAQADLAREYLTVCHDICHSAVMGEDQQQQYELSRSAGIRVGKVQVSSAIRVAWSQLDLGSQERALVQLSEFAEDRYLHQTLRIDAQGNRRLEEDLPEVIKRYLCGEKLLDPTRLSDEQWLIHFHVPIYLQRWGYIESTQSQIIAWLKLAQSRPELLASEVAYEVETYAWGVLPSELRRDSLDEGIAQEIAWLQSQLDVLG
jgi:hypothetical protein